MWDYLKPEDDNRWGKPFGDTKSRIELNADANVLSVG